jgi:hypothetical protein
MTQLDDLPSLGGPARQPIKIEKDPYAFDLDDLEES